MNTHLLYGIDRDNELRNIEYVPSGLSCDCKCPNCGERLVAKKGDIKIHHFAHIQGIECEGARLTALHLLAQKVLAETKAVILPTFKHSFWGKVKTLYERQLIGFDDVKLEKRYNVDLQTRIPDCVCITSSGKTLWVEIKVTHGISPEKKQFMRNNHYGCIEFDLSELYDIEYSEEQVRTLMQTDTHCHWINFPGMDEKIELIKKEMQEQHLQQVINSKTRLQDFQVRGER